MWKGVGEMKEILLVIQALLLAIQIVTGIKWMCIPIILLTIVQMCLKED